MALPWSGPVWPILGSMFMFRLIVYLYDLSHEKTPGSVAARLSYFFMLPNVCFPLFPVIDYQAFRRTYYDHPDHHQIYQVGLNLMFRGVIHLLIYRFVYHNLVIDSAAGALRSGRQQDETGLDEATCGRARAGNSRCSRGTPSIRSW